MERKKILICADMTKTDWHPLHHVKGAMENLLAPFYDLTFTEHFESLGVAGYQAFDLVIFRVENYMDKEGTWPSITNDIVTYVAEGGRIFMPHLVAATFSDELAQMFGFRFRMHPPMEEIRFTIPDPSHPAVRGLQNFSLFEERMQLIYDLHTPREVFLEMETPAGKVPAGWFARFGQGLTAYLVPGHDHQTYTDPSYQQLFLNIVGTMLGEGGEPL